MKNKKQAIGILLGAIEALAVLWILGLAIRCYYNFKVFEAVGNLVVAIIMVASFWITDEVLLE